MARQSSYRNELATETTLGDKLTGVRLEDDATVNFTLEQIAELFARTNAADPSRIGFQFTYAGALNGDANNLPGAGEFVYVLENNTFRPNTDYRAIQAIIVSPNTINGVPFMPVTDVLIDQIIKVTDISDANDSSFAFLRVTSIETLPTGQFRLNTTHVASAGSLQALRNTITITPSGLVPGDRQINVSDFDIFQGNTANLPNGPQGAIEAPDGSLFLLYDNPLNPTVYRLYGPKQGPPTGVNDDGWGEGISLVGPQGIQGIQGEVGPRGPRGLSVVSVTQEPANPADGEDIRLTFSTEDPDNPTGTIPLRGTILVPSGERGAMGLQGISILGATATPSNPGPGENTQLTLELTDGRTLGPFTIAGGAPGTNGTNGTDGAQGPQGRYTVQIFRRATTAPATPTVTWTEATEALTNNPDGWSLTIPSGTEQLFESEGTFNPATGATTITTWSAVFQAGSQGPTGPAGQDGMDGADGADGTNGTNGTDGVSFTGITTEVIPGGGTRVQPLASTGPVPTSFIIPQGLPGLNGANGEDGTDGVDGRDGVDGTDGTDGRDGRTVLSGTVDPTDGVPPTGTGVEGDFYINEASNEIFGPKDANNIWGSGRSLVGPPGADGEGIVSRATLPTRAIAGTNPIQFEFVPQANGTLISLTSLWSFGEREEPPVPYSPSIYRWIGDETSGQWTDDHYILRTETFPEEYPSAISDAFVGRTVYYLNNGTDPAITTRTGLYRWQGGVEVPNVSRWQLIANDGISVRESGTNATGPFTEVNSLNFVGSGITLTEDNNEVTVTIRGGGGVADTITPTLTRFSAAPILSTAQTVALRAAWETTGDVTVTGGTVTHQSGAAVNITAPFTSPKTVQVPNVTFPLGTTRTFVVTITGTTGSGETITGTASVDVELTLAQPTAADLVRASANGLLIGPYSDGSIEFRDAPSGANASLDVTISGGSEGAYTLDTSSTVVMSGGTTLTADSNGRYPLAITGQITAPVVFSGSETFNYAPDTTVPNVTVPLNSLTYPIVRSLRLGVSNVRIDPANTAAAVAHYTEGFLTGFGDRRSDVQGGMVTQAQISAMSDRPVTTTSTNRHIYFAYGADITATPRILIGQSPNNNLFTRVPGTPGGFIVYASNQPLGFRPNEYDITLEF